MSAPVRIEEQAWTDPRFGVLGKLCGIDRWSARDRVAFCWALCTRRGANRGRGVKLGVLTQAEVDSHVELEGFAAAMVGAQLAEWVNDEGSVRAVRMRGATQERVGWLDKRLKAARKGGLASGRAREAKAKQEASKSQPSVSVSVSVSEAKEKHSAGVLVSVPDCQRFDLELVYAGYPRKVGKATGLKRLKPTIKTEGDYGALKRALASYVAHVAGWEIKYVKHFDTWCTTWKDWVDFGSSSEAAGTTGRISDLDRRLLEADEARMGRRP